MIIFLKELFWIRLPRYQLFVEIFEGCMSEPHFEVPKKKECRGLWRAAYLRSHIFVDFTEKNNMATLWSNL